MEEAKKDNKTINEEETTVEAPKDVETVEPTTSEPVEKATDSKSDDGESPKSKDDKPKRFLPEHKKPDAAPTFPEKLMKLMQYADTKGKDFCVTWLDDGKSFIIRQPAEFTRDVVPQFFKPTKFSSFTRKLYRWGFRQVNRGIGPDDPIIFGNEHFQRDNAELMAKMRSTTAASTRKIEQQSQLLQLSGMKHGYDGGMEDPNKRIMLEQMYQQKAAMMAAQNPYGSANGTMSLSNALRPNMGGQGHAQQQMMQQGQSQQQGSEMQQQQQQQQQFMYGQMTGYDMMQNPGANNMGQFMPQNFPQQPGAQQGYPNSGSTAEIVNAAISALRYAS